MSILLGLTGGIACGKTTISGFLKNLGCVIIDADQINAELSRPGQPIWRKLKKQFPAEIFLPEGSIDRIKLGQLVFDDPEKRKLLQSVSHPLIIEEENKRIEETKKTFPENIIVLEAALLIEAGEFRRVDKLLVVTADIEKRKDRLLKEKNISREKAQKRIDSQMSCEQKIKLADYVIENNGSRKELKKKVEKLFFIISSNKKGTISEESHDRQQPIVL